MKKVALAAVWLVMAAADLSHVNAADRARGGAKRAHARVVPIAPEVVAPIVYDTGINAGFHPDAMNGANNNRVVGNRFNSALGGPLLMTNMVTMISVFPANAGAQSVSIAAAPTTMNTAMVIDYFNANLVANQFNVITLSPTVPVGPDFLGVFIGTFGGYQTMGLLGMSDMSINGQGFHAIQGFYVAPAMQTMLEVVPNRNAMLRPWVDWIPVELMDFKIE